MGWKEFMLGMDVCLFLICYEIAHVFAVNLFFISSKGVHVGESFGAFAVRCAIQVIKCTMKEMEINDKESYGKHEKISKERDWFHSQGEGDTCLHPPD